MFLTTHVTVYVCHAELNSYLLTYLLGAKCLGGKKSRGELTTRRNVHKSVALMCYSILAVSWEPVEDRFNALCIYIVTRMCCSVERSY